jgi:hypothetical protein
MYYEIRSGVVQSVIVCFCFSFFMIDFKEQHMYIELYFKLCETDRKPALC